MSDWKKIKRPFREALLGALNWNKLATVLQYHCDRRLDRITSKSEGFDKNVDDVIADAVQNGWLEDLARGALAENETHTGLNDTVPHIIEGVAKDGRAYYQGASDTPAQEPDPGGGRRSESSAPKLEMKTVPPMATQDGIAEKAVEQLLDAFITHSQEDALSVEKLAETLADEYGFQIWLEKWMLVPGESRQQKISRGFAKTRVCIVCIGSRTPHDWFREEIEMAFELQKQNPDYRVIPVLLPDAEMENIPEILTSRTWIDLRGGAELTYEYHKLKQGIKGEPVGRWSPAKQRPAMIGPEDPEQRLMKLHQMKRYLHDENALEYERKILDEWLSQGRL